METLTRNLCLYIIMSCGKLSKLCIQIWFMVVSLRNCESYLNNVEDNILVEAVQDTLGYTVVIPGSMDEQQILQVFELCGREVKGQDE